MIYPTLRECLDECRKTGILKVEGLSRDEYILRKAGFRPRLMSESGKTAFFHPIPY